jgi:hypothetical protein
LTVVRSYAVPLASLPPRAIQHVSNMVSQTRKNSVTSSSLLADLTDAAAYRTTSTAVAIPAGTIMIHFNKNDAYVKIVPKTPTGRPPVIGSPDDYFIPRMRPRQNSRWRDEFEELELLVRIRLLHYVKYTEILNLLRDYREGEPMDLS